MNAEQKKRAREAIDGWNSNKIIEQAAAAYSMAELLQELLDVPEQAGVPVCRVSGYFGGYLTAETIDKAAVLPNGMALYAAPQAQAQAVQETWPIELCEKTLATLTYIRGIAERGEGRPMRDDETLEQFLLGYVKRLEAPAVQADLRDAERWKQIATVAHCGGLAGLSESDALVLIRRLTLPVWDKSKTHKEYFAVIDAARAQKNTPK